jgi:hypothetical protein
MINIIMFYQNHVLCRSGTWVEDNIVEAKVLEIDCEALGEVHKFIIWLRDSINIYMAYITLLHG